MANTNGSGVMKGRAKSARLKPTKLMNLNYYIEWPVSLTAKSSEEWVIAGRRTKMENQVQI